VGIAPVPKHTPANRQGKQLSQQSYRYAVMIYVAALTAGSLQPLRPPGLHDSVVHQLLHFVCFGVLVLLARGAFPGRRSLVWIVSAAIFLGATLEFLQHWEFQEGIEWPDIGDDAMGAALSALLCNFWKQLRN
jgi:hypothetical protein